MTDATKHVTFPDPVFTRFSDAAHGALRTLEHELLFLALRLGYIVNVQAELERASRGKLFTIHHEPMMRTLLGERDMTLVDLDSWIESLHGAGGFLKSLSSDDRRALRREWERTPSSVRGSDDEEAEVERLNANWRAEAYRRLFPAATTSEPTEQDLRTLGKCLYDSFEPVRRDRNQWRAHKYDRAMPKSAAILSPADVVKHHDECRQLLADLRLLATNSSFTSYGYEIKATGRDDEARDVVDLILFGDIGWIHNFGFLKHHEPQDDYYWQKRDAYLEQLHSVHTAAGEPGRPFNNRALIFDAAGRPLGPEKESP